MRISIHRFWVALILLLPIVFLMFMLMSKQIAVLVISIPFYLWVYWHMLQVKEVVWDGGLVYISYWGRTIEVALTDVACVKKRYCFLRGVRLAEIYLKKKTVLGRVILFAVRDPVWV